MNFKNFEQITKNSNFFSWRNLFVISEKFISSYTSFISQLERPLVFHPATICIIFCSHWKVWLWILHLDVWIHPVSRLNSIITLIIIFFAVRHAYMILFNCRRTIHSYPWNWASIARWCLAVERPLNRHLGLVENLVFHQTVSICY